ncbi:MAG: MOSC N-terminal beta barrel domain-containing protein [Candidatus Didemnitutus sp.]|nr:MOSC N-terminal beta barrel domain-containing protein [Candidatus Didemnitutus sp.]
MSGLFIYPVKSCRGLALAAAEVDELGLAGDRRFLVVDEAGKFLTQRTHPRMAQIATALDADRLTLSAEGAGAVAVPRAPDTQAPLRRVTVWKHSGLQAEDCGPEVAQWLSDFLGLRLALVRIGPAFERNVLKKAGRPGDRFSFADGSPVLVTGEASLADLNDRIVESGGEPVPMERFRPNVVVSGAAPFAEDDWPRVRGGDVVLRAAGKSDRCIVTTTDQHTGQRGKEPLRTLATFRRDPIEPTSVYFGANFINESKRGTLRVGDAVVVEAGA